MSKDDFRKEIKLKHSKGLLRRKDRKNQIH